ncbi:hypothetical protein [Chryseobacterium sp.]|uniref:hypothetical protein n=1 Tax=Chryseobacterium sp. TaxID=1871047 RepID=UPI0025B80185|nr:hypothetical protein [Chryseobacterium sp.]
MNNHLSIPSNIQQIIDQISNTDLNLAELPLPEHPKLPHFDRFIRVLDIDAKSKQEFINFTYEQVLRDKVNGEEFKIALPTPEWVIYKETWSYLRDENNNPFEVLLTEPTETEATGKVRVPTYRYMLWLLKNDKIAFLDLLKSYLKDFIENKGEELDKLS